FCFDLLLVGLLIIVTRVGCILHEAGGHALVAYLLGAKIRSLEVTLFAGGSVDFRFPVAQPWCEFWSIAAGMLLNFVSGVVALLFVRRCESRPVLGPLLAMFGAISILLPLAYLAIGLYYGVGDPESLLQHVTSGRVPWDRLVLSLPFLALTPWVSYLAVRPYCRIQQARFPSATYRGRLAIGALTLGVASIVYLGLYALSQRLSPQHLAVFDAPQMADHAARVRLQSAHWFPMIPAVALFYLLGAALGQLRGAKAAAAAPLSWRATVGTCIVAFAIIAAIYATAQRFI
ncbi:MAG TPA: hypothetical protein VF403_07850, partial [Kofleriaceae bacterium]